MTSTTFSTASCCIGAILLGMVAGCAEGEPIADDFMATSKGGHGGKSGQGGSLAAGGSTMEAAGTEVTTTGSGGMGGAGGSGGSATGGGAGSASDAGMAGGGAVYDGPLSMGIKIESTQQATNLQFQVKLTNNGTESPPVSAIRVRYYFVADSISDASQIVFDHAAWNSGSNMAPYNTPFTGACKATFGKVTPAKPMADSYIEFGADSGDSVLHPTDYVQYQVRLNAQGEDPTNDYSYKAGSALVVNDHMTVLQGGNVIAGMAP